MRPVAALCLLLAFSLAVGDTDAASPSAEHSSSDVEIGRQYAGRYADFIPKDAKHAALEHISEEEKREVERYASQKKWAADNTDDMQRVEEEHKDTLQRLAKARAGIEKEFGSSDDSSSHSKESPKESSKESSKKDDAAAVLLADKAGSASDSKAGVTPLVKALEHLAEDEQREVERFVSQKKWAGDNTEDMQRVEQEHKETLQRLAKERAAIEKKYESNDSSSSASASSPHSSKQDATPAVLLAGSASDIDARASPLASALKHLADDEQREVERYASQKKWAGDNADDMQRVEEEHKDTLQRLAKARAGIEKEFGSSDDSSSHSKESPKESSKESSKKDDAAAVLLADKASSASDSEARVSPLKNALEHLAADEQREVERYASQQKWAGENTEDRQRVEEQHKETLQRLAKARAEIEKRFGSSDDSSSHSKDSAKEPTKDSSKKEATPAVLLAGEESESDAARATLVQELKHLAADEQREVERYAAQKQWAGESADEMHRVEKQHQEAVQRLAKAREEIEKRFADAGSSSAEKAKTADKGKADAKPATLLAGLREGHFPSLSAVAVPSAAAGALLAVMVQRLWRPRLSNTLTESLLSKENAV